ncbi:MAG TPA: methyl-accepting chemotaxis protein [Ktedonobacterales bacterium]|nr:methyl-accepting chemotaxis protein [Ktedonobacterales bacterium]
MMNRGGRPASASDMERRAQQIKEVVRASTALRADMPPEAICALVAQTIHSTLGFRAAVVNLIIPGNRFFAIVATAGISDAERQRLLNDPPPVDHILSLMRPDFQVSRTRSYFIGHEHKYLLEGAGGITLLTPSAVAPPRSPNAWHPDDVFFVPLISVRDNRLLGIISLDLPEDGKIPSFDTVEVIELLANQAATALDTARLFQERDHERQALQQGLEELLAHLDRMRQRDLSSRAHLRTSALTHVAGALNDVSETLGNVLVDVREAGMVVQQQASEMRNAALQLVSGAQQQAEQIQTASQAIQRTSEQMRQIVTKAAASRAIAEEANSISNDGREAAERAGEGMSAVREITLQAARRIKRLGESSQEISNVIQLVSEFASQTHLLALNAAIEAANAGEHGSGFAIVAREIRNLAQNSNDATKQIHARIKGIQNETNQVAVTVEYATQQVVQLSDLVTRSGTALHAIDTVIQEIIGEIAMVHHTAEEQAKATTAVSGTMNTIAGITGATWEGAEYMRASMDQLAELAAILQAKIEMFRLNERLHGGPASSSASLPLYSSGVSSGLTPGRITSTPASSFPAVPFPATSSPGTPAPATSYPANPFPTSTSSPKANAANGVADGDLSLEATVPMPAIQPSPIFPTGSGPLTPMRIFPLDNDASASAPPPSEPTPDAQPERESEAQDVPDAPDRGDMQEETPVAIPEEAVTGTTADQASPNQPPEAALSDMSEISSVARMEQAPPPAPELTDEAAPETTPLRAMETKPLPALESTGQAAPENTPNATPDDLANAAPEPQYAPDSSSDDESAEDHSADPA